jgi:bifunctional DNA-binding transcriptional regulator/antitoxin component of YhaV-PrlF toxin-antitoxin module
MRKQAGLKTGDTIMLIEREGRIIIEKTKSLEKSLQREFDEWDALSDEALARFERKQ